MFDYLTKTWIITLKKFEIDSVNYLGWNWNLSIRPSRIFLNTVQPVSMNTKQWEILSWKTAYAMILANNAKWVSNQLFGCGKAKLGPQGQGDLYHLMFITELLIVWPVCQMSSYVADWSLNLDKCPGKLNCQATNFLTYTLTYATICNALYGLWKCDRGMGRDFWGACKRERVILKLCTRLNAVSTVSELEPANVSSRTVPFWVGI